MKQKLKLSDEQRTALMAAGRRFWFLPGRATTKCSGWERGFTDSRTGKRIPKVRNLTKTTVPDCVVFCDAVKVNPYTVVLRLPDGSKPKMYLEKVFMTEEAQVSLMKVISQKATPELMDKYNNNESFYVTVTNENQDIKEKKMPEEIDKEKKDMFLESLLATWNQFRDALDQRVEGVTVESLPSEMQDRLKNGEATGDIIATMLTSQVAEIEAANPSAVEELRVATEDLRLIMLNAKGDRVQWAADQRAATKATATGIE